LVVKYPVSPFGTDAIARMRRITVDFVQNSVPKGCRSGQDNCAKTYRILQNNLQNSPKNCNDVWDSMWIITVRGNGKALQMFHLGHVAVVIICLWCVFDCG
jgi:hypothetical protein